MGVIDAQLKEKSSATAVSKLNFNSPFAMKATFDPKIFHLMALFMQDESVAKLQKQAIFAFLKKPRHPHHTISKLLANPFNWKVKDRDVERKSGELSVVFTAQELYEFIEDITRIRTMFSNSAKDQLDIPCKIISAQLTQIGTVIADSTDKGKASQLLQNTLEFHKLLHKNTAPLPDQIDELITTT